ncbi:ubiquinone biosynthesis methyltransferase UbiE [Rhizobium sp. R72]|uniref:ubiquinone biosynthesis methyltransferase UbiE n=1 Tax=unclassified Rhizobium TaxID=2613769 RepID=UPI000B680E90|nr:MULTISPECIES: ubiquinone biosynthesis methyltransferase UbiE [unclassified Rhizobium]OWW05443.1 ubiquinone biosynthesis methyltransferase UbiE [Rhizobium sp. R72]OWW06500.1 ubiquinone biosynthesis methyltransferase UbiE [Rhizobium sp. R711]
MEMATFTADWLHCDQLSNYVARMVSHDRRDPLRHSNLLSSALNELLEMSFRSDAQEGALICAFYRHEQIERIELSFPCPSQQHRFYSELVEALKYGANLANYVEVIADETVPLEKAILLGLAVNYDADIELRASKADALTFVVDLPLARLLN